MHTKLSSYQRRMQVVGLLVFTYFTGPQGVPKFPDPDCRTGAEHSGRMFGSGVVLSQSMYAAFRQGTQDARGRSVYGLYVSNRRRRTVEEGC